MLNQNNAIKLAVEDDIDETDEAVSDLLYTMFQTMDEYITNFKAHGKSVDDLIKMQQYVEKEMRWYAQKVYKVEVDKT